MKKIYRELFILIAFAICSPNIKAQVDVILQLTPPLCGGFSTGSIQAIPISGQDPFFYEWSNGSSDNPIENLSDGVYTVTVTDANGATGTASGELISPPMLDVLIKVTECGVPGTMEAEITGGTPPLNINWNNGETTPTISDLQAGQYCITVTDDNSCAFQTCEFTAPEMIVSVETDTAFCGTGVGGNAYAVANGGVIPYEYEWNTGQTVDTLLNITPGEYIVTVTASNGCVEVDTGKVELQLGRFDVDFDIINPGCIGTSSGSITAIPSNGIAPYEYLWSTGDTVNSINNLSVGKYYITITDTLGCISVDSVDLVLANVIMLSFDSNAPSCPGSSDGTATAIVENGNPPYNFLWVDGDTTATINNLSEGTYTVFVTDSLNCLGLDSVTISDPSPLELGITSVDLSDCGGDDGMAYGTANGGEMPYSFLWSNGATTDTINNLAAGTYILTVTDAKGCQIVDSTTVNGPVAFEVSVSGTELVCWNENKGELIVEVINGTPPFQYNWSNGDTTSIISGLPANNYYVTVTNQEGCIGIDSFEIINNPEITINESINDVSCFGFNDGSINVLVGGGTSPLDILWDNGSNSTIRNALVAGQYTISVSDEIGCSALDTFQVNAPDELSLTFNNSAGSCGANGFSIAIVVGGNGPYTYLWETGDTTSFIDQLPPGNYDLTVTDQGNCSKTGTANIPSFPFIDLAVFGTNTTCNGNSNGTATASAMGGVPPFTYEWDNGGTTMQITDLSPGTYFVTVTDSEDCTASGSVEISMGIGLDVSLDGATYICNGQTGTLTAMAVGGTSFYSYIWSNGETTQTISNLTPDYYAVTVTDPFGCTGETETTLLSGGDYAVVSELKNVDCFGESTGQIELSVVNELPPAIYQWAGGETTSALYDLPAGSYSVMVSDFSGCTKQIDFDLTEPPLLEVDVVGTSGICGNLGSVISYANGGTKPYNYLWNTGSVDTSLSILGPGTYVLTLTDAKGCEIIDSATIDVIPTVSCDVMLMHPVTSINGDDGELSIMVEYGTAPYEYDWNSGQTTQTISDLFFGNYTVTVTDANDCMTDCNFVLLNGARIGNLAWFDVDGNGIQNLGELGIEDITVQLEGMNDYGEVVSEFVTTNVQGLYSFDVIPGSYELTFSQQLGLTTSPNQQGGDLTTDSDIDPISNKTNMLFISGGQDEQDIDAGFFQPINCDNITNGGMLCCDQNLCAAGDQPTIISSQSDATGGTGTIEYLWMYSEETNIFDPNTWTSLSNSNTPEFVPIPLDTTTYFIRLSRRSGCSDFIESNIVEILVNDFDMPEITGIDTLCTELPASFSANDFGPDANYSWSFENGLPNVADSIVAENIVWEQVGDQSVSLIIDIDGCILFADYQFFVTESPQLCGFDPLVLEGEMTGDMRVILDWRYKNSTAGFQTFLVEWANDTSSFMALGPPDATENLGDVTRYFHTHENPSIGENAYRVVLKDTEGNELISNVVTFQKDSLIDRPSLVHIYPNPFNDRITFEINDRFEDLPITFEMYNTLGQLLANYEFPSDLTKIEMDTKNFASGTYFFFIKYGGKPQKIVKMVK